MRGDTYVLLQYFPRISAETGAIRMTRPGIYFSHQTALQIIREIGIDKLVRLRGQTSTLPSQSPSTEEVANAIAQLECAYPHLHIERPAHILVGSSSRCRFSATCQPHRCAIPLSYGSFYKIERGIYVASPPLAFIQMTSQTKDKISLIELGYELTGTYQTLRTATTARYQVPSLTSVRALRDYANRNASLNGAQKVLNVVRYITDGSASARETKQALVLGLPHRYGGAGLGIPHMNYKVETSREARAITGKKYFRCDLCWPEAKLDVEYQSRAWHEGEEHRISDSRRTHALTAMDWTVVAITGSELDSLTATDVIAQSLRKRLGIHSQIRIADYHARKLKLRRQLGLPMGYD